MFLPLQELIQRYIASGLTWGSQKYRPDSRPVLQAYAMSVIPGKGQQGEDPSSTT